MRAPNAGTGTTEEEALARARIIKPGFFDNEDLTELPPFARLLFLGLLLHADREGRLEDRPRRLKAAIFPFDDVDVDSCLTQLAGKGFIVRYAVDGRRLVAIPKFGKHQKPHPHETASELPGPDARDCDELLGKTESSTNGTTRSTNGTTRPAVIDPVSISKTVPITVSKTVSEPAGSGAFDFQAAFARLKATYPPSAVSGGALTERAFWDTLHRAPDGPRSAFDRMLVNLDTQIAGDQWRRGMIPKLARWLTDGLWEQQHEPAKPERRDITGGSTCPHVPRCARTQECLAKVLAEGRAEREATA